MLVWLHVNITKTTNKLYGSNLIGITNGVSFGWFSEHKAKRTNCEIKISYSLWLHSLFCILVGQSNKPLATLGILIGKTSKTWLDPFNYWRIKQIADTWRNLFSRSYENCSNGAKKKNRYNYPVLKWFTPILDCLLVVVVVVFLLSEVKLCLTNFFLITRETASLNMLPLIWDKLSLLLNRTWLSISF